jgi:hypothetical protein
MAQSYPDKEQQSGPWQGPRGITRDEADDLSKQLKPRWERASAASSDSGSDSPVKAASGLGAKKTLLGMNVPDEATTTFEASAPETVAGTKPRLKATVSGMPAVNVEASSKGSAGTQKRHNQTVMGIPTPIGGDAALKNKGTMVGIPVPVEAQKTGKQTALGIPVPAGIANADVKKKPADDGTLVSASNETQAGPAADTTTDTISDVIAPSTPFQPAVDSVPAKPFATVRAMTPPEVMSDAPSETEGPFSASSTIRPVESDDDLYTALGAQRSDGKKKAMYAAIAAIAAAILLAFAFSGSDDESPVADADSGEAAPQLAEDKAEANSDGAPATKPKTAEAPKPDSEKPEVQQAKAVEPEPKAATAPTKPVAPSTAATPKPVAKAATRDEAALQDRKPPRRSGAALPATKKSSGNSKGALLRDPAAKRKPAAKPRPTTTTKPAPAPRKKKKGAGTIVRDTPF